MPLEQSFTAQVKSDRVRRLTASCIRSVVKLRYWFEMTMPDALDLAYVHDLRSAVEVFGKKLEVHTSTPETVKFTLVVNEAKLTGANAEEAVGKTVEVRRASMAAVSEGAQSEISRDLLISRLRVLRRESEIWARDYSRFLDRLAILYKHAEGELKSLRLEREQIVRAEKELQEILVGTVQKAAGLYTQEVKAA